MGYLSTILAILKLIPQIWSLIKSVVDMIKRAEVERKELQKQQAIEKLQKAKTEQEVKDAAIDYLNKS